LRAYYFDQAPELLPYMLSVPPTEFLPLLGLPRSRWQLSSSAAQPKFLSERVPLSEREWKSSWA
jgi:hypothetical protein